MKRRLTISLAATLALTVVTACSSSGSKTASSRPPASGSGSSPSTASLSGVRIAYTNATDAAALYVTLQNGLKAAVGTVGAKLTTYDNRGDASTTLSNAQLVANSKPDFVLSYDPIQATYAAVAGMYKRAKIPCIAINVPSGAQCGWFDLSNKTICGDSAQVLAKAATAKGWTGADTRVLLVNAASFGTQVNSCMGDFYYALQQDLPGLAQIAKPTDITPTTSSVGSSMTQVDGKATNQDSFNAVSSALHAISSSQHIILYTVTDDSTLGAFQAITRAGRAKDTLTAGLGGSDTALQQLRTNPQWIAEGDIFFAQWGQYLLAMAAAMRGGVTVPDQTEGPDAVLTKSGTSAVAGTSIASVDDYYRSGSSTPYRLPPLVPVKQGTLTGGASGTIGNGYLAATGVLQQFKNVAGLGAPKPQK